jgi:hypothetical protein
MVRESRTARYAAEALSSATSSLVSASRSRHPRILFAWLQTPLRALASVLLLFMWGGARVASEPIERPHADDPKLVRPSVPPAPSAAIDELPPPPPASLVKALEGDPYGENCVTGPHPFWPFDAATCSYTIADHTYSITTATPSAERVARWFVDASPLIPAMDGLRTRAPQAWEASLASIARYTMSQSGRAFPIDGVVFETFEGPTPYLFKGGVTYGTEGGKTRSCGDCACRIESLHRSEWCTFVADGLARETSTQSACMASLGGDFGWNDAWASKCLELHASAWESDRNDAVRALFHYVDVHQISVRFPDPDVAEPSLVVEAIRRAFEYPHRSTPAPN